METLDLVKLRNRHNALAGAKAAGYLVLAAAMWVVSWFVLWYLMACACMIFSYWWLPSFALLRWLAWVGVAVLAVEGFLYGRNMYRAEDYAQTLYADFDKMAEEQRWTHPMLGTRYGGPIPRMSAAYWVSAFLFSAPRFTVKAWTSLRERVSMDDETLGHADAIVAALHARKTWIPVRALAAHASALYPLSKLKVIWTKLEGGEALVRLDTDYS